MPSAMPDLTGVEPRTASEAGATPSGWHRVRITEAEDRTTPSGAELINVRFEIAGKGPYVGRTVFDDLRFSEKSLPWTKGKLEAINFRAPGATWPASLLVGQECLVFVQREAKGYGQKPDQVVPKVKAWASLDSGRGPVITDAVEVNDPQVVDGSGGSPAGSPGAAPGGTSRYDDSDIPF